MFAPRGEFEILPHKCIKADVEKPNERKKVQCILQWSRKQSKDRSRKKERKREGIFIQYLNHTLDTKIYFYRKISLSKDWEVYYNFFNIRLFCLIALLICI